MRLILLTVFILSGCATVDHASNERVYASQIVTGWRDADGHMHLKGEGGADGFALVTGK